MARRIWNDIRAREDPPNPGEDNKQFRHTAYRQFVVWQYGTLGRDNRIVIPSCCVWKITDKYPDPHNHYGGFIPRRLWTLETEQRNIWTNLKFQWHVVCFVVRFSFWVMFYIFCSHLLIIVFKKKINPLKDEQLLLLFTWQPANIVQ